MKFHSSGWARHHRRRWRRTERVPGLLIRCSPITWRRRRIVPAKDAVQEGGTFAILDAVRSHVRQRADWRSSTASRSRPANAMTGIRAPLDRRSGRHADPGVAAGDDGEGGSHRPGAPRKVHPEPDPVPDHARRRRPRSWRCSSRWTQPDGARAVRRAPRPTRCARPATTLIDPLGLPFEHYDGIGQWRDTDRGMDDGRDGRVTNEGPITRSTACRRWRSCSPTCPTRAPATRRSGSVSPKGSSNADGDKDVHRLAVTRFTRNTRSSIWWRRSSAATRSAISRRRTVRHDKQARRARTQQGTMQDSGSGKGKPAIERRIPRRLSRRALLQGRAGRRRRAPLARADAAARPARAGRGRRRPSGSASSSARAAPSRRTGAAPRRR